MGKSLTYTVVNPLYNGLALPHPECPVFLGFPASLTTIKDLLTVDEDDVAENPRTCTVCTVK